MQVKYKENLDKLPQGLQPSGAQTTYQNHVYIHLRGEKELDPQTQRKNLKKALIWTICTLGLALFSSTVQNYWHKARNRVIRVNYFVNREAITEGQKQLYTIRRETLTESVRNYGLNPQYAGDDVVKLGPSVRYRDQELMIIALKEGYNYLTFIPKDQRNDKDIALNSLRFDPSMMRTLPDVLKQDPKFIIDALRLQPEVRKYINFKFFKGTDFFLGLISELKDLSLLAYAPPHLLKNPHLLHPLEALIETIPAETAIVFNSSVPEEIRGNHMIIEALIQRDANYLSYATEKLRGQRIFALEYIKQNPRALEFISDTLRNDLTFVEPLILQNGLYIRYLPEKLKSNESLALKAVHQDSEAYAHLSQTLRSNTEFFIKAYRQNPCAALINQVLTKDQLDALDSLIKNNSLEIDSESKQSLAKQRVRFLTSHLMDLGMASARRGLGV